MKKIITTTFIALFAIAASAQFTGHYHYQSYSQYESSYNKSGNNCIIKGSNGIQEVIFQFNLDSLNYTYLNDSLIKDLNYYIIGSDSGYAVDPNFNGKVYYTYNNWKTIIENPTSAPKLVEIKRTSSGFIGYIQVGNTADIYHSKDLINWTKTTTVNKYATSPLFITEIQGQLTIFNRDKTFYISTDGGQTFTQRNNTSGNAILFTELVLMTDTATILTKSGDNDWYFTNNSGKNWTKTTINNNHKIFYAEKIDSLYATSLYPIDSLYLSVDTGKTWQPITQIPLAIRAKSVQKNGDYFVEISTMHYSKNLTSGWIKLPLTYQGGGCVSFNGNYGITGGGSGNYSYTHNGGKTFETGKIVSSNHLTACKIINDTLILFSDNFSNTFLSKDGGITWSKTYGNSLATFGRKFTYSEDLKVMVQTRAGQPLLSQDYGNSWNSFVSLGGEFDAEVLPNGKIYFVINNYDFNTKTSKVVIENISTQGNRTIIKTFTEADLSAFSLKMLDNDTGFCFARSTKSGEKYISIFKTTDGWNTYTLQGKIENRTVNPGEIFNWYVTSSDTLYLNIQSVTSGSIPTDTIYYSFNGGVNWQKTVIQTNKRNIPYNIGSIHFFDNDHFIAFGSGGIFLNKDLTGSPVINPPKGVKALDNFNENTVYPNPNNGILNLKQAKDVQQINVYSITGNIIKTFKDMNFIDGLDIQELPNGMYILQIINTKESSTIKIIKE